MYSYLNGNFKIIITRGAITVKIIALHYLFCSTGKKKDNRKPQGHFKPGCCFPIFTIFANADDQLI